MTALEKTADGSTLSGNTEDRVTAIITAFVSNNAVAKDDLPGLINSVRAAVVGGGAAAEVAKKPTPAEIRKSITPDALISFIDGQPYKALRRHLTGRGMTFDQYKERFGLPSDYPAVAASYSEKRSQLAKDLGLGQTRRKKPRGKPAA